MRGYLTFGHHNSCKRFVACMHGSEIVCQLLELLCNHLVHGVCKVLKDTVRKNSFTFFDWSTWAFLQINHLLSTAEQSLLELDATYLSRDERSISADYPHPPQKWLVLGSKSKLTELKQRPVLTRISGKGKRFQGRLFLSLLVIAVGSVHGNYVRPSIILL